MRSAERRGAHLIHFPEACLTGYLGAELKSAKETDWDQVRQFVADVRELAAELGVYVVLGCNHPLTGKHKPHNSLYVIDNKGRIKTRYDKLFCTGSSDNSGDLKHYSPGSELITFTARRVQMRPADLPRLSLPGAVSGVQEAWRAIDAGLLPQR